MPNIDPSKINFFHLHDSNLLDIKLIDIVPKNGGINTTWNSSTQTCENVLQRLDYTIFYTSNGTISNVTTNAAVTKKSLMETPSSIEQRFSVSFLHLSNLTSLSTLKVHQQRKRSGNPGYIKGFPTLAAKRSITNDTLELIQHGLSVMGAGNCETTSESSTVSSCSLLYNLFSIDCTFTTYTYFYFFSLINRNDTILDNWFRQKKNIERFYGSFLVIFNHNILENN